MLEQVAVTGKPLQVIPWSQKTKEWYKKNGEWFISRSNFKFGDNPDGGDRKDLRIFYEVYNNQFPLDWFKTVTDPLSAKNPKHKAFPAKIRPISILRTNIDLLLGEYPRRPFVYNVENLGESGYNQYMEDLNNQVHDAITQHFIQEALRQAQAQGQELNEQQLAELEKNPPLPEDIKAEFETSYKDSRAIKGQKWLRKIIREKRIVQLYHKLFFDWLIAGQCYTFKGIINGKLQYRKVSPLAIDYDASLDTEFVEDGGWAVERRLMLPSDVVDEFYTVLKTQDVKDLEGKYLWDSPDTFYSHLSGVYTGMNSYGGKVPVYRVEWKGMKMIKKLSYFDEETFQSVEIEVDEDFDEKSIPGAKVTEEWRTETYQVERIGKDLFVNGGPVLCQRDGEISAGSKLRYNGKKFSNTHAENISILEIGLPLQIMYIIITYILERTIAKSKGKILLMDANAIPTGEGKEDWDEEKSFYYAEALGYMLLDRNQIGVDKSWNQYTVLDMSLFDNIKQLIELKESVKQEWDDLIGVNRQRKGQTYASDAVGNNERATFQSTVITDMIFSGFEEFTQVELQGLLDLGKYMTANGLNATYQDDDYGTMLLEIAPEDITNAELGVFVDSSADHIQKLRKMEQMSVAMLQNNAKPSTMMEVIDTINAAELKQKLRKIESIEQDIAQQQAESEQEHQQALEDIAQRHAEYLEILKRDTMEAEYDRKEDLEHIRGAYSTFTFQDGDSNDNGTPDALEVQKMELEREKFKADVAGKNADRAEKAQDRQLQLVQLQHQMNVDKVKLQQGEKKLAIDKKKAAQRPKAAAKK